MTSDSTVYVIQVAMDEEAVPFIEAASEVSEPTVIGRAKHRGLVLAGRTVVLVTSGVGMVNAADAVAGSVFRYGSDLVVISAGTAGGLASGVAVGDVIVGTETVNVEVDVTAFGYALGQVPGMPATYPADATVRDALAAAEVEGIEVRRGEMGAGEKFVTVNLAHTLRERFPHLISIDQETAAVAQAAYNHGARFAVARGISDLCAPDGDEFKTHVDDAAERSAKVVIAALERL